MNTQEKNESFDIEITIFKYLIYIFLIIVSYKLATAISVSYGFFPKDQMPGLAVVILAPLYLLVFMSSFVGIFTVFFLASYYFFKSKFFKKIVDKTIKFNKINSLVFWILLGALPFLSLSYFDTFIDQCQEQGYVNRKEYSKDKKMVMVAVKPS